MCTIKTLDYFLTETLLHKRELIAWFAQNPNVEHEKIIPIPIGLPNQYWYHMRTELYMKALKRFEMGHLRYSKKW